MAFWIIPCNKEDYDVYSAFSNLSVIDWKQNVSNIEVGDIVFIYITKNEKAIRFECEVIAKDLPTLEIDDSLYQKKKESFTNRSRFMRLRMIREINNPKLSYNELKKHGLTNVRNQVSVNLELQEYISELELIDLIRDVEDKGYIKECITKARVNQGKFRDKLLREYGKCCLCGLSIPDLLVASHIKPWNISSEKEKLSLDNGLLLCAIHDKLFDKGFISFDVNGQIIISDEISRTDYSKLNLDKKMKIAINKNMNDFMKYHRENIFIS